MRQDNEQVVLGPEKMVTVPPRHFVTIVNPVARAADGSVEFEGPGEGEGRQAKLRHADREIRLTQDPFPLYPGEEIQKGVTPLTVVPSDTALRLRATLDFEDRAGTARVAGDEWLFEGPGTYVPQVEVDVVDSIKATIIRPNQALRIRARKECADRQGRNRVTGEEWLVQAVGAYLPGVFEQVVGQVDSVVLTDSKALHLRATEAFTDPQGKPRRAGEEWLVTVADATTHMPGVHEVVVAEVEITTLTNREWTVILDPHDNEGRPQLGKKKLVAGPASFFLRPGEALQAWTTGETIVPVYVLGEDDGLILRATEAFSDASCGGEAVDRTPGDRWMIRGPADYVPPIECQVVSQRQAIPLDDNEGIYVRNIKSGKVRCVAGKTYMLNEDEELWEKELPPVVEELLGKSHIVASAADRGDRGEGKGRAKPRDKSRAVVFRVPHNGCVQIYDYAKKQPRVVFGPEAVMLGPDEQFTQLSLSGGKPKRPNEIKALVLLLGPDFCTDIITIETADHARLQLQLSYNWKFEVDKDSPEDAAKIFSVPDFVGDLCKAVASRVRGAVAGVQFDDFHKNSAKIIRTSVFGVNEQGKVKDCFRFPANNLCITSIDIQSAEPVDQRTRDALQKSVQLAIEITTNSQEAQAKHEAQRLEQEARGKLERQQIEDQAGSESSRRTLIELQSQSAAVESTGQAKAEAQSRAEAARIEGEAAVALAKLKAEAMQIESDAEIRRLSNAREAELEYQKAQDVLAVEKSTKLAQIESTRFAEMVTAIGADTIRAIAVSGPELQAKLLGGLGIKSTLITDGKTPISLFETAAGMLGGLGGGAARGSSA